MRSRYKINEEGTYFVTSTILNWTNLFYDKKFANIIVEELNFRIKKHELQLFAYVIMPNHFHLILSSDNIPGVMRRIKSYTAKKIIRELELSAGISEDANINISTTGKDFPGTRSLTLEDSRIILGKFAMNKLSSKSASKYQIWQEGYHPKMILTDDEFGQKINYIHNNPVKKGLVNQPEEWKYSSYRNYYCHDDLAIEFELPYSY